MIVHVHACVRVCVNYELLLAADKPSSRTCRSRHCSYEQLSVRRRWLAVASRAVQEARSMMDGGARRVGPVRLMTAGPERLNDLLNLKITPKKTHFMCNLQPRSKIPSKAIWI